MMLERFERGQAFPPRDKHATYSFETDHISSESTLAAVLVTAVAAWFTSVVPVGRRIALSRTMTIHHRGLALATASLLACGPLTVIAQQQAAPGLSARAGARRAIVKKTMASTTK